MKKLIIGMLVMLSFVCVASYGAVDVNGNGRIYVGNCHQRETSGGPCAHYTTVGKLWKHFSKVNSINEPWDAGFVLYSSACRHGLCPLPASYSESTSVVLGKSDLNATYYFAKSASGKGFVGGRKVTPVDFSGLKEDFWIK